MTPTPTTATPEPTISRRAERLVLASCTPTATISFLHNSTRLANRSSQEGTKVRSAARLVEKRGQYLQEDIDAVVVDIEVGHDAAGALVPS